MKHRIKNTLRGMSKHLGIKVKFVDYFDDDVHGKLLPREKRILINARKPRNEHIFTLFHEIGHYLIHFKSPPRKRHPRFCDVKWEADWLARLCSQLRRYFRFIFNSKAGKEWDADLWAMCAFLYTARHCGFRNELVTFLERHPEKTNVFLLAVCGAVYSGTKKRIEKIRQAVVMPFQTLWKFAVS
jgi:hypothetical protein